MLRQLKKSHSQDSGTFNRKKWLKEIDWYPSKLYRNIDKATNQREKETMMQRLRDEINASIDNSLTISIVDHA